MPQQCLSKMVKIKCFLATCFPVSKYGCRVLRLFFHSESFDFIILEIYSFNLRDFFQQIYIVIIEISSFPLDFLFLCVVFFHLFFLTY